VALTLDHLEQREEHWAIVDLVGKGGHIRTVPVPDWVRAELDDWLAAAAIDRGRLFRRVNKVGRAWGDGMTDRAEFLSWVRGCGRLADDTPEAPKFRHRDYISACLKLSDMHASRPRSPVNETSPRHE